MDDFGSAIPPAVWLKRYPISSSRSTKGFVDDLAASHDDAAIVQGMIALANRGLGMGVVAEGSNPAPQFSFLAARLPMSHGFPCSPARADRRRS